MATPTLPVQYGPPVVSADRVSPTAHDPVRGSPRRVVATGDSQERTIAGYAGPWVVSDVVNVNGRLPRREIFARFVPVDHDWPGRQNPVFVGDVQFPRSVVKVHYPSDQIPVTAQLRNEARWFDPRLAAPVP